MVETDLENLTKANEHCDAIDRIRGQYWTNIPRPALDEHILIIQDAARIAANLSGENIIALGEMKIAGPISPSLSSSDIAYIAQSVRFYLSGRAFGRDQLKQAQRLVKFVAQLASLVPKKYWEGLKRKAFPEYHM